MCQSQDIEDEAHFMKHCLHYNMHRNKLYNKVNTKCHQFHDMTNENKLIATHKGAIFFFGGGGIIAHFFNLLLKPDILYWELTGSLTPNYHLCANILI